MPESPNSRVRDPSHDELFEDVVKVRRRGVGNVEAPLDDLAALLWAAQNGCPASYDEDAIDDDERIEYVLRLAVSRLGGKSAQAIEALLGLSHQTRGHSPGWRRGEAAKRYGKSSETFRVRFETPLLMTVTTYLHLLVAERRLTNREELLKASSKGKKDTSNKSLPDDFYDDGDDEVGYPIGPLFTVEQLAKLANKK
jgi:hypothetical protein